MKNWPPELITALSQKTGIAPVWILKLTINNQDWYLSDAEWPVAPWGITCQPLVANWGQLQEGVSNSLGEFQISEYSVEVISDPAASPNMLSLFLSHALAFAPAELYIWVHGLSCTPGLFCAGNVKRPYMVDEHHIRLDIQDESVMYENHFIGTLVDRSVYPAADPDDVGKVMPIVYGSVSKLRTLALDAGMQTSIPNLITATQTSFVLSSSAGFEAGLTIVIDDEEIYIISLSGDTVSNCTRGYNGTIAAKHNRGAVVWESKDEFVYVASSVPLDSINKVYGRVGGTDMDITAICGRYTGKTGSTHPAFPGMAVVTVPGYVTVQQAVDLLVNDGLTISDAAQIYDQLQLTDGIVLYDLLGVSDNISVTDNISVADNIAISDPSHGHSVSAQSAVQTATNIGATVSNGGYLMVTFPSPPSGANVTQTDWSCTVEIRSGGAGGTINLETITGSVGGLCTKSGSTSGLGTILVHANTPQVLAISSASRTLWYGTVAVATTSNVSKNSATGAYKSGGSAYKAGGSAYRSPNNTSKGGTVVRSANNTVKAGSQWAQRNGSISIHGNSVANTLVGDEILVDVTRNITLPGAVCADLNSLAGRNSFRQIGTLPPEYRLDFAITEYKSLQSWCNQLAIQCRCWFRMHLAESLLIVREDNPAVVARIAAVRLASDGKKIWSADPTDINDIINKITLKFDKDWSGSNGSEPFKQSIVRTDDPSITKNGIRERPQFFNFDMISNYAMALNVADFYIRFYSTAHHLHNFDRRLDFAHLEFGDCLQLDFCNGIKGVVQEAKISPGSASSMDRVEFVVLV